MNVKTCYTCGRTDIDTYGKCVSCGTPFEEKEMKIYEAHELLSQVERDVAMEGNDGVPFAFDEKLKEYERGQEALEAARRAKPVEIGPVRVINCTPHEIRFQVGDNLIEVPPSGATLKADAVEQQYGELPGVEFVKTVFVPSVDGQKELAVLARKYPRNDVLFIGSIISVQAFSNERLVGMVPVDGFERVPPAEKRYRNDKFNVG